MEIRKEVPNGPEAAAQARRLLDPLESRIPEATLVDARIVLSEIVSNSYKHAGNPPGAPIEVTVTDSPDRLRLEILDRSIFDPTPESIEELRAAKWGLHIVDLLADEWGRITEGGIWAEFDIQGREK
jgi:anti-sigma regulatory factor (Ser/Thr protein kinase)